MEVDGLLISQSFTQMGPLEALEVLDVPEGVVGLAPLLPPNLKWKGVSLSLFLIVDCIVNIISIFTCVLLSPSATSLATLLLANSTQPSVKCLAIPLRLLAFSTGSGCRNTLPTWPNWAKNMVVWETLNPGGMEER